jgi:hypothetical protein
MIGRVHSDTVGHHGVTKTIAMLNVLWEGMRKDVLNFVRGCAVYQKSRITSNEVLGEDFARTSDTTLCSILDKFNVLVFPSL